MKNTLQLQLAFHHHQPVGNFESVLEDCYRKAYLPLLEALADVPGLKVHLSYSGPLLEFLAAWHPDYLDRVRDLVEEGRVEFLATGHYEPVLTDISRADRIGQLEKNCRWIEERFGCRPRGAWLAEAVWKTSLCAIFRKLGLDYTLIRAERFLRAGIPPGDLNGHYFTEYLGDTLALFPIDSTLVDLIPFGETGPLLGYLRRQANRRRVVLTHADTAERWGIWPGTQELVGQSGGLRRWFELLAAQEWIETRFFSEVLQFQPPRGRCYLPEGANVDLGLWSLPDRARERFKEAREQLAQRHDREWFLPYFSAGSWEGFRARYGEAHLMARKGEWLRGRAGAIQDDRFTELRWRAQCNTAYWHGTSGGIYLPHLRAAIWENLLAAQCLLGDPPGKPRIEIADYTADGIDEILVYNADVTGVVSPAQGGAAIEVSLLPLRINLSNTLTRRREERPRAADGQAAEPVDPYERHWFHEHFYPRQITARDLASLRQPDLGDFADGRYRLITHGSCAEGYECVLDRRGEVDMGGTPVGTRVRKTYVWEGEGRRWRVDYEVINEGGIPLDGIFATEINLLLGAGGDTGTGQAEDGPEFSLEREHMQAGFRTLRLRSGGADLALSFSSEAPLHLWAYPIRTSGGGLVSDQPLYQGTSLVLGWDYAISPGEATRRTLVFEIEAMGEAKK